VSPQFLVRRAKSVSRTPALSSRRFSRRHAARAPTKEKKRICVRVNVVLFHNMQITTRARAGMKKIAKFIWEGREKEGAHHCCLLVKRFLERPK
jgi:hypothetical protein